MTQPLFDFISEDNFWLRSGKSIFFHFDEETKLVTIGGPDFADISYASISYADDPLDPCIKELEKREFAIVYEIFAKDPLKFYKKYKTQYQLYGNRILGVYMVCLDR